MFTEAGLEEISRRLDGIVQDKPEEGVFRARRDMFTDPELFELEMKHIWEGNWIYLAHESQIPNVNDTFTTHIGRQPIMITRDKTGPCTRSSMPARIAARCCAATSGRTRPPSPAHSMAGPSTTRANCSR